MQEGSTMSAPAPVTPTEVMSSTASKRHTYNPSELPHRTQSLASRGSSAQGSPHRSNSHSQSSPRPPSASRQAALANVAQRDYEQTNLARSSSSRRSSMDRYRDIPEAASPPEPSRQSQANRASSRSGPPSRYGGDGQAPPPTNGQVSEQRDHAHRSSNSGSGTVRRRTTVTAQTGTWSLGKTIGAGSMGKVKLAKNLETGEQAAIKIVPRHSQDEHRTQQDRERADQSKEIRTAREAAIVTLLNHPYICGMRDVYRTNYHWYMLFEYVNGGQMLDYIISHGRLKEKQARKFGRQIASALDYCHRNSIVHRDLKIENILISKEGNIKIIDFGLSNLFSPRSLLKTFCGSLYFAAPELLQAKAYTGPEVDIWSFGIVLYVLVCGKVPFDDQSMPQLHAKIKKGVVEYPPWLSHECKHIIGRMLVTDPRQRATLSEIMNHGWMTKGFSSSPENCLPPREPLQLPLDQTVIEKMTGFDFGSTEYITKQLQTIINSEEYQRAVKAATRKSQAQNAENDRKKSGIFDLYQRRKSSISRDTLSTPSTDAIQLGDDPINAFSPLLSIYYLVREKRERERIESNPGALTMPKSPGEKPFQLPDLPAPEAAYTNPATFEMAGEAPTGGRSRPRARTHGEDEIVEKMPQPDPIPATGTPAINTPPAEQTPTKKEGTAIGILRRFSTRRGRDSERERSSPQRPPSVAVSGPDGSMAHTRPGVNVRKTRERDVPPSAYQNTASNHPDLLAPPGESGVGGASRRLKGLGRSTSVNSGDLRRRWSRKGDRSASEVPTPAVSGSERSSIAEPKAPADTQSDDASKRSATSRARSLGHAQRESIHARRANRTERPLESDVPEETDADLAEEEAGDANAPSSISEPMKPVYLKGLFSVSTTSNKPLAFIRADIIRVLKQLGVDYKEIKGGFSCRHLPSIDLNKVVDVPPASPDARTSMQKRRISFAGIRSGDRDRDEHGVDLANSSNNSHPRTPRTIARKPLPNDTSYTNSEEESDDDGTSTAAPSTARGTPSRTSRAPGETTTHVQSDLGQSMILKFEILVVKVPILSLHGLQFKKVDGGTWQYKKMAENILSLLRL